MRIAIIAKPGHADTGVGRYTSNLSAALQALGHEVSVVNPIVPLPGVLVRAVRRLLGWDLHAFFQNYPIWVRYPEAEVYHFASQNLATLLVLRRPPGKTVVTIHDIIPWLVHDHLELRIYDHRLAAWFDRLSLAGLQWADGLLADSMFTLESLGRDGMVTGEAVALGLGGE